MRNVLSILAASLCLVTHALASPEAVRVKWDGYYLHNNPVHWDKNVGPLTSRNVGAGWTNYFNAGAPEESNRIETDGELDATLYKVSDKPTPFVVWMHGCTGLPKVVKNWTVDLAKTLKFLGIGLLVVDSHSRRFVSKTCGHPAPHWGRRRADDAASALDYLIESKLAKPDQVYVMGQSNGGLATLNAVDERMLDRKHRFAAAFAMEPPCVSIQNSTFYAPIFFLLAETDDANPAESCLALAKKEHKHPMQVVVMKGALHSYMFKFGPTTTTHGKISWREGYNERAAKAGMQVIAEFFKNPKIKPITEYK